MPNILFLTQVLPYPLDAGPKVRAYHVLRHLASRHAVTLVSFVRPDDTSEALAHLATLCEAVQPVSMRRSLWRNVRAGAKGLITGLPMVIARDEIVEMTAVLRRLTAEHAFDVVHADQLSMAAYGQMAARFSRVPPATLLDEHNAIYVLMQRMAQDEGRPLHRLVLEREARAFARYETAACRAYDAVLTVTAEDRDRLLALYPDGERETLARRFTVLPICVDPEQTPLVDSRPATPPTILHLGTMFWPPNVAGVLWFVREVLPLIHREQPAARFVVVGKAPPPEVQALAADPRIEVTGYIPDPRPYLEAAGVFIVPLHAAAGMRVKILDAWLWGLPIVSTPIGAEGIETHDGQDILIAADAGTFAAACLRLLVDPGLRARLRGEGRSWVEKRYAWQTLYRQLGRVYERLLTDDPRTL